MISLAGGGMGVEYAVRYPKVQKNQMCLLLFSFYFSILKRNHYGSWSHSPPHYLFLLPSHPANTAFNASPALLSRPLNPPLNNPGNTTALLACPLANPTAASLPHLSRATRTAAPSNSRPTPSPLWPAAVVHARITPRPPRRLARPRRRVCVGLGSRRRMRAPISSVPCRAPRMVSRAGCGAKVVSTSAARRR